jgi:anti-sigma factor ChrR (cupin superfamily)
MKHNTSNYDNIRWKKAPGYPVGTKIKILRDEGGIKTILLKLPKGFNMEAHTHVYNEQHFVLAGKYESEGKVYTSGNYRFIPAHKDHGPFTSKTGAVILIIWEPINVR